MSTKQEATFIKWQKEEFKKSLEELGESTATFTFEQIQEKLEKFKLDFVKKELEKILKRQQDDLLVGISRIADRIIRELSQNQ